MYRDAVVLESDEAFESALSDYRNQKEGFATPVDVPVVDEGRYPVRVSATPCGRNRRAIAHTFSVGVCLGL